MNGIWSVKDKEDNGTVKFRNPLSGCSKADFSQCMSKAQQDAVVGTFNDMGETTSLENISLLLPTRQNVEAISAYMKEEISKAFDRADIPEDPPVEFSLDGNGQITVKGDRPDIEKIQALFKNNDELGEKMHNFLALASQMPAFERAVEYTEKYEQAHSQAEIDALNREYSDLFDGKNHYSTSFTFSSSGLDMNVSFTP